MFYRLEQVVTGFMRLFRGTFLQEYGKSCDCCVVTSEVEMDIFADDEDEAKSMLAGWARLSSTAGLVLQDLGEVPGTIAKGVKQNRSRVIFEGVYYESPL